MVAPTDRAQDTEAIRAARRKQLREHARRRLNQNALLTCEPSTVLEVLDEVGRLVARLEAAEQALTFYADPLTYFGVGIAGDEPTGGFMEDIDEVPWPDGGTNWKPGKRARAALAAAAPGEMEQTP